MLTRSERETGEGAAVLVTIHTVRIERMRHREYFRMKRLRAIVLAHEDLVPPDSKEGLSEKEIQPWKTEYAVADTLREMGHEVQVLGVSDDLQPIRRLVEGWQAQIIFNLLRSFRAS